MGYGLGDDLEPGEGLASATASRGKTRWKCGGCGEIVCGGFVEWSIALDGHASRSTCPGNVHGEHGWFRLVSDDDREKAINDLAAKIKASACSTEQFFAERQAALDRNVERLAAEDAKADASRDEAAHRHALHVMAVNASGSVDREYATRAYLALRDVFDDVRFRHGRKSTKQALLKLMAIIESEEAEERRAEKAARHEAAKRTGQYAELVGK